MGWTYVPMLFNPLLLNAVFFTWPALFNQNADDLSAGGFFYTVEVLYKKNLFITTTNIFSKSLII